MKVLMVAPRVDLEQGGPSFSVCNLCKALATAGADIKLFSTDPKPLGHPDALGDGYEVELFRPGITGRLLYSGALLKRLRAEAPQQDLIHINTLWSLISTRSAQVALHLGIPYVITPRGMLSAWRRSPRYLHKELYYLLFERRVLRSASLIHLLTQHELEKSAPFLGAARRCVVPNGVWPQEPDLAGVQIFRERFGLQGMRYVVSLGRIHPIKRPEIQCHTFHLLSQKFPDLRWVFIGPDGGMVSHLRRLLGGFGLLDRAVFTGLLDGKIKEAGVAGAEVYCHTSEHEGHSVAITEALSSGKPCVITKGCNFPEVATAEAGFVVENSPESVAHAIESLLRDKQGNARCGANAANFARQKFSWPAIARLMISDYEQAVAARSPRTTHRRTAGTRQPGGSAGMKVLMVVPRVDVEQGGPSFSVCNLCKALSTAGVGVKLLTTDPKPRGHPDTLGDGYEVELFRPEMRGRLLYSKALLRRLRVEASQQDLIHIHTLWNLISTRAAQTALKLGTPYVLTPHGMLSAWKRSLRKLHKEVYFFLCDRRVVQSANLVHILSQHGLEESAPFLGTANRCVVPNGVWPQEPDSAEEGIFRERFGLERSAYVVCLGRIHPIKRLDIQCRAFRLLLQKFPDLRWVFIGPDSGGLSQLQKLLGNLGLLDRVVFTGLLNGKIKEAGVAGAEIYCQTSEHEDHSVAITEALSLGKPCVITEGCNLPEVAIAEAGFVVENNPESVARAIEGLLRDNEMRVRCGANAANLARQKFLWPAIARQMISRYEQVLRDRSQIGQPH